MTNQPSTTTAIVDGEPTTVDISTGEPTAKPTAKVVATAITSTALVVVIAVLAAVTPEMLTFAGAYSPLIYAGIVALGGALAGYIKRP